MNKRVGGVQCVQRTECGKKLGSKRPQIADVQTFAAMCGVIQSINMCLRSVGATERGRRSSAVAATAAAIGLVLVYCDMLRLNLRNVVYVPWNQAAIYMMLGKINLNFLKPIVLRATATRDANRQALRRPWD